MEKRIQEAYEKAKLVREMAYAPYSNFLVGAALVFSKGNSPIFASNVENASYGATICAERIAICSAVAQGKREHWDSLILVTDPVAYPCGLCLQVMAEHCPLDFTIYLANTVKIRKKVSLKELLPYSFRKENLG